MGPSLDPLAPLGRELGPSPARQAPFLYSPRGRAGPGRRLAWSTAIFSLATGLSRILGLVREIVAAYYFSATGKINAFTVAFQVPNLIRALVADAALSSAFVPVFSELLEKGERKRAWRVASTPLLAPAARPRRDRRAPHRLRAADHRPVRRPRRRQGARGHLSRILFPIVVLLGVSGIIVGILNSYEHFTVPALTPVFWNLAIIAGLVLGVPRADTLNTKLYVYAFSIVIGTVIQVLLPLPWLYGLDDRLRLVFDWRDPAVRRVFVLMLPVTIGLGLINFNLVVDTLFASRFVDPDLAPRAIDAAFRIYMLPQGMFSVAIATVLFPRSRALSARAGPRRLPGHRRARRSARSRSCSCRRACSARSSRRRSCGSSTSTASGRRRGRQVTASALAAFSLGLTFNGVMLMLNRAFFSLQTPWTPTGIAVANLL